MRLASIVFLDSLILLSIVKEAHKEPLLPPINSSMYILEIRLVYDLFLIFIESQQNAQWKNLVDFLMEIQL